MRHNRGRQRDGEVKHLNTFMMKERVTRNAQQKLRNDQE